MNNKSAQEILRLMNKYCFSVDEGDFDTMAELFDDATFQFVGDSDSALNGAREMREMLDNVALYDGKPLTKHTMSNVQIDVDEQNDSATAQSYITVLQAVPPDFPLQAVFVGCYHDIFERVGDVWRFNQRSISPDLIGDLSFHRPDMS